MEVKINVRDMHKLESPFVREEIDGKYVVTNKIAEGYEWVFEDDSVKCVEKLHGTNVSIMIQDGVITGAWNRTERLPFFNKNKKHIIEGLLNSYEKGHMEFMADGQWFGEAIGPKINGNPYNLSEHRWIPFNTYAKDHLAYKSWGRYSKDFVTISNWFRKDLMPLYSYRINGRDWDGKHFVEGVVFTHPDGRMAKLRKDMYDWWYIDNPSAKGHNR
jgi:hypothetical protein